jgi:hypothetical protein
MIVREMPLKTPRLLAVILGRTHLPLLVVSVASAAFPIARNYLGKQWQ